MKVPEVVRPPLTAVYVLTIVVSRVVGVMGVTGIDVVVCRRTDAEAVEGDNDKESVTDEE